MARPQLQIEKRMDQVEEAVTELVDRLAEAGIDFTEDDAEGIKRILRGEDVDSDASEEPSAA